MSSVVSTEQKGFSDDTLFNMQGAGGSFLTTKRDITKTKVVGVVHRIGYDIPGVNPETEQSYDMFWSSYFQQSQRSPLSMCLINESAPPPGGRAGSVYLMSKPIGFINDYLFGIGLRKALFSDSRDKSPSGVSLYEKAATFFSDRGGKAVVDSQVMIGFPVVRIAQEPKFSSADSAWIKNEWYPKLWVPSRNFEDTVYALSQQDNVMASVGAAHAFHLWKRYHVPIALTMSLEQVNGLCITMTQDEYLLRIAEK